MITNLVVTAAVDLASRRAGKRGDAVYSGRARMLVQRNFMSARTSSWIVIVSGFIEPVFYLFAFGYGIGGLIGTVDVDGKLVEYAAFVAPALLATSAMNGALYDSTWNVFFKMHFGKTYQAILSTSLGTLDVALGEIGWALLRGLAYAIGFMAVMAPLGLVVTPWAILAVPAAVLVAFGFAAIGMGITTYVRSFHEMNWINFFLLPMFLFSGTFYPITVFPVWLQNVIQAFPLWQAVDLIRSLMLGDIRIQLLGNIAYFLVMVGFGLALTTRRLTALFMR
jgi:lipooligosaccharide transport system permease protein